MRGEPTADHWAEAFAPRFAQAHARRERSVSKCEAGMIDQPLVEGQSPALGLVQAMCLAKFRSVLSCSATCALFWGALSCVATLALFFSVGHSSFPVVRLHPARVRYVAPLLNGRGASPLSISLVENNSCVKLFPLEIVKRLLHSSDIIAKISDPVVALVANPSPKRLVAGEAKVFKNVIMIDDELRDLAATIASTIFRLQWHALSVLAVVPCAPGPPVAALSDGSLGAVNAAP